MLTESRGAVMFHRTIRRAPVSSLFLLAVLTLPLMAVDSPAQGSIYKYVDDAGTLNFTSEWYSIPERYRSRVETVVSSGPPPSAPPAVVPAPPVDKLSTANVRTVRGVGEYRMGDHDTRYDAERLAVESAKRNVLEQIATYMESVTVATNLDISRDDIRSYTAGLVLVQDQQITTSLDGNTIVVRAEITAQADPDEVLQAITALRQSEDARTELVAVRQENEQLQQRLDELNRQISMTVDPQQAQLLAQQRDGILDQVQSNALVSQAWTDYVIAQRVAAPYPWFVVGQARSLLGQARTLYPANPHVASGAAIIAPQGLPPASLTPSAVRIPRHLRPRPPQSPTWPTVQPQWNGSVRSTLPPPIHQMQPLPPQPIPRHPFHMSPGLSPAPARSHGGGGHAHGGGGHGGGGHGR